MSEQDYVVENCEGRIDEGDPAARRLSFERSRLFCPDCGGLVRESPSQNEVGSGICTRCGARFGLGEKQCWHCGTPLSRGDEQENGW